jgi:hypothetical protein
VTHFTLITFAKLITAAPEIAWNVRALFWMAGVIG